MKKNKAIYYVVIKDTYKDIFFFTYIVLTFKNIFFKFHKIIKYNFLTL